MSSAFLLTLTATGFSIAALHAAIPTHWLPFVLIGRARGWSRRRTLAARNAARRAQLRHVCVQQMGTGNHFCQDTSNILLVIHSHPRKQNEILLDY